MKKHLIICIGSVSLGVLNYSIYRPNTVLVNKMFAGLYYFNLYEISSHTPKRFRIFCANYLSDILWAFFVYEGALMAQKLKLPIIYVIALVSLPVLSETGQLFNLLPGTFDLVDIGIYTTILICYFKKIRYETVW